METLILFADAGTRPDAGDPEGAERFAAYLLDMAAVCGRWGRERVAVDPNRRVVVHGPRSIDAALLGQAARLAGGALVVDDDDAFDGRLHRAFAAEFTRGARAVAAVGAHTPTLPLHFMLEAFRALVWERVVLGPTFHGGCWLLGATRPAPEVFVDARWSEAAALPRVMARARTAHIVPALLSFWYDATQSTSSELLAWHLEHLQQRRPLEHERTRRVVEGWTRGPAVLDASEVG